MRRILAAVALLCLAACASISTYPRRACRFERLRDGREVFVSGTVYQSDGTRSLWRSDQLPDDGQHLQWVPAGQVRACRVATIGVGGGW